MEAHPTGPKYGQLVLQRYQDYYSKAQRNYYDNFRTRSSPLQESGKYGKRPALLNEKIHLIRYSQHSVRVTQRKNTTAFLRFSVGQMQISKRRVTIAQLELNKWKHRTKEL
jgi:hypothetical protein